MAKGPIDMSAVKSAHRDFLKTQNRMVKNACEFAGLAAYLWVRDAAPFKQRHVNSLKTNTRWRIERRTEGTTLTLYWTKKHAIYLEDGTPAHSIAGRNGGFLKFRAGGKWIIRRAVWHPGTKATKFAWTAQLSAFEALGEALKRGMAETAHKF